MHEIRNRTGSAPTQALGLVISEVEGGIRALKILESEVQSALLEEPGEEFTVDGVSNLPAPLGWFLAERSQYPGFQYDVVQDEVRGWVIRWKEYTQRRPSGDTASSTSGHTRGWTNSLLRHQPLPRSKSTVSFP